MDSATPCVVLEFYPDNEALERVIREKKAKVLELDRSSMRGSWFEVPTLWIVGGVRLVYPPMCDSPIGLVDIVGDFVATAAIGDSAFFDTMETGINWILWLGPWGIEVMRISPDSPTHELVHVAGPCPVEDWRAAIAKAREEVKAFMAEVFPDIVRHPEFIDWYPTQPD